MQVFCCGRSTIIDSHSPQEARTERPRACPVPKPLEGYVLCGTATIRKCLKCCGANARTAGCKTSFKHSPSNVNSIQVAYGGVWGPVHGSETVMTPISASGDEFFSGFEMSSGMVGVGNKGVCEMSISQTDASGNTIK